MRQLPPPSRPPILAVGPFAAGWGMILVVALTATAPMYGACDASPVAPRLAGSGVGMTARASPTRSPPVAAGRQGRRSAPSASGRSRGRPEIPVSVEPAPLRAASPGSGCHPAAPRHAAPVAIRGGNGLRRPRALPASGGPAPRVASASVAHVGGALPARAEPALDRAFRRRDGWIGGDGVGSVDLGDGRILWLFGDSFIGSVRRGRRRDWRLVNNAVAIQNGQRLRPGAVTWFWGDAACGRGISGTGWRPGHSAAAAGADGAGKSGSLAGDGSAPVPAAANAPWMLASGPVAAHGGDGPRPFVLPPDGRGWLWPLHGAMTPRGLLLFFVQIDRHGSDPVFGFRTVAVWQARIADARGAPTAWRIVWRKVPWVVAAADHERVFGSAVVHAAPWVYVYGIDERLPAAVDGKRLVVARVPDDQADDLHAWQFWGGRSWTAFPGRIRPLAEGLQTEFSVHQDAGSGRWLLVQTETGFAPYVGVRTASRPEGPFGGLRRLGRTDAVDRSPRVFCYAGKAHPEVDAGGRLLVTWVANAFDFDRLLVDASLYWPRLFSIDPRELCD